MSSEELQAELDSEIALADRALEERAKAIDVLQAMAESARVLAESFRMALKFHDLDTVPYQKTFSRYHKVLELFEKFNEDLAKD